MDLTQILQQGVERKASDIHISTGLVPTLRIYGEMTPFNDLPVLDEATTRKLLYSIMNEDEQKEFEKNHEIDFSIYLPKIGRFRVNAFYQLNGIAGVFRVVPEMAPTLEELGAPPIFKHFADLSYGLIIITGPSGCGKSTTLAAMINYINTHHHRHIITIEDPIEFTHTSQKSVIHHRQVGRETKRFTSGLRAALREDPDVILVGEMRDLASIRLALTAAETGHLVLSTLHTSTAPHAINRIVDVFPSREKNLIKNQLSESIQGVICQSLIKTIKGGRVAAFEILVGTPAVRNLIREGKTAQIYSAMQTGSEYGMQLMEQSIKNLVDRGIISEEEAEKTRSQRAVYKKPEENRGK